MMGAVKTMLQAILDAFSAILGPVWQDHPLVTLWVMLLLAPVNMASFGFVWDWLGIFSSIMFMVALGPNLLMLVKYKGIIRLMGAPHLVGWIPLEVAIGLRLGTDAFGVDKATWDDDRALFTWAIIIGVVDGISIIFDAVDTYRWYSGSDTEVIMAKNTRARLGLPAEGPITAEQAVAAGQKADNHGVDV